MSAQTVIEKLAATLFTRTLFSQDEETKEKWEEKAEEIVEEYLPSGSGFDSGTKIIWEKTTKDKIVFQADFHHMDDNGYYDGWTEHQVTVRPGFLGMEISVSGRNKRDIKDYILDTFRYDLEKKIIPPLKPACPGSGVE